MAQASISDDDYAAISPHRWNLLTTKTCRYAIRTVKVNGRNRPVYMHRQIMGLPPARIPEVDHVDRDGLNNQRSNLRVVTISQNKHNRGLFTNNTSGVTGVCPGPKGGWRAYIMVDGKARSLGFFDRLEDAVSARKSAELSHAAH